MFSYEFNGYNKKEVDSFISSLKAEHERKTMEERLKVLEAERKMLDMKNRSIELEKRQNKIISALETYKKTQAEGKRNIEVLRGEQLKVIYLHLQSLLENLKRKYPSIIQDSNYKTLSRDIETILKSTEEKKNEIISARNENDPMRMLLNKMQEKKVDKPREVQIERTNFDKIERSSSQIKPVTDMQLDDDDDYDNLVDKFLNTAPIEEEKEPIKLQSSGFDINEAINPTQDLSEIMKAFDFYTGDDNN